ncbi:hypothetical protein [Kribbella solani]|uniref:Uncharacterized protein n=1 Tax=Kribbella solani TaxID=236067 RepID=A0A841DP78_9ACTN|nr:hypothetical protein [Kribbella solani]MBB5979609.1 hypothetical protein [Kribbella solani]
MRDVAEQRLRAVDAAMQGTVAFKAVPLAASVDDPLVARGLNPVNPCACVTEPCPCDGYDHGNTIVWMPRQYAVGGTETGTYDAAGSQIMEYQVPAAEALFLDSFEPISAAGLAGKLRSRPGARPKLSDTDEAPAGEQFEQQVGKSVVEMFDLLVRQAAAAELYAQTGPGQRTLSAQVRNLIPAMVERFAAYDQATLINRLTAGGATSEAIAALSTKSGSYGGLREMLLAKLNAPGAAFEAEDTTASCWLSVGLIVAGVLIAPKMPVLAGFAIGFGTTTAAGTC